MYVRYIYYAPGGVVEWDCHIVIADLMAKNSLAPSQWAVSYWIVPGTLGV